MDSGASGAPGLIANDASGDERDGALLLGPVAWGDGFALSAWFVGEVLASLEDVFVRVVEAISHRDLRARGIFGWCW